MSPSHSSPPAHSLALQQRPVAGVCSASAFSFGIQKWFGRKLPQLPVQCSSPCECHKSSNQTSAPGKHTTRHDRATFTPLHIAASHAPSNRTVSASESARHPLQDLRGGGARAAGGQGALVCARPPLDAVLYEEVGRLVDVKVDASKFVPAARPAGCNLTCTRVRSALVVGGLPPEGLNDRM